MYPKNSRTALSLKNIRVNTMMNMAVLVLNFFSRKIFIEYLGADVIGLNSTICNILEFLNFAELGIMSGVRFMLYKPFHDNDTTTVNEIITLQGLIYRRISVAIILLSLAVAVLIPLIFGKMTLPLWYAYASFVVFLYSYLIGNFVNYRQVMFHVSQQSYVMTRYSITLAVVKIFCQMGVLYYLSSGYVWWLACEVFFATTNCIMVQAITRRYFRFLRESKLPFRMLLRKYGMLVVKVRQLFFHRVGAIVLTRTTPVIIYAFTTLAEVAVYGNYKMIVRGIQTLVDISYGSIGPSIGNLMAEDNKGKSISIFHEVYVVRLLMTAVATFAFLTSASPFISLWLGESYVMSTLTVSLIAASLALWMIRMPFDMFIQASGLFHDVWSPIFEVTVNLGCALAGGWLFGLNGILGGSLAGTLIIALVWKPYFLFRHGLFNDVGLSGHDKKLFFRGLRLTYWQLFKLLLISSVSAVLVVFGISCLPSSGLSSAWLRFILSTLFNTLVYSLLLVFFSYVTDESLRRFMRRFLSLSNMPQ